MSNNDTYSVVITTTDNQESAKELASKLVEKQLAACVQLQDINSFYFWKGEACNDPEVLLLIKTRSSLFEELCSYIKENHSYENPEIIQIPITQGASAYLQWISDNTNA